MQRRSIRNPIGRERIPSTNLSSCGSPAKSAPSALSSALASSAVFAGADLDVDAELVERLRTGVKLDRSGLASHQVHLGRGAELDPIRQMDFDAHLPNRLACGVPDRPGERLARAVVADDQLDPATGLLGVSDNPYCVPDSPGSPPWPSPGRSSRKYPDPTRIGNPYTTALVTRVILVCIARAARLSLGKYRNVSPKVSATLAKSRVLNAEEPVRTLTSSGAVCPWRSGLPLNS